MQQSNSKTMLSNKQSIKDKDIEPNVEIQLECQHLYLEKKHGPHGQNFGNGGKLLIRFGPSS